MASVQELIESMLDEKLATLVHETRESVRTREAEKWRIRTFVIGVVSALAFVLVFVYEYRAIHETSANIQQVCEDRNRKEAALLRIINLVIERPSEDVSELTPQEVQQRAADREVFIAARQEYSRASRCGVFK